MAGAKDPRQPIVIKRVKKGGHGHHGGAWKIAYADFVTAMMAFFLLMWLLGSTTQGDLQGISDYFRTPLKVAMTGGSGAGETASVIQGGAQGIAPKNSEVARNFSRGERPTPDAARRQAERDELAKLNELKRKMGEALEATATGHALQSQIRMDLTPEGLRVQIVDDRNRPMFDLGSAIVKDYMREILREMGKVLNTVDYRITLSGHTDAKGYAQGERGYSNWELSADRANASRRELIAGGMDESKIVRVVGAGSAVNLNKDDPNDPINRRISIIVMNKETERRVFRELGTPATAGDATQLEEKLPQPGAAGEEGSAASTAERPADAARESGRNRGRRAAEENG